ncbi:hypothetical protein [Sphingomonas baiyangensis]|uniref:Uncharacterized protein n=1 Tax=Sphingomonas baiyangensis TaxID=2572576 RepID=A0A4U1L6X0_9SPHN|nr:hypothetical protein [Sphingomonas baiyangensis]TKD52065.1 hypothetical protein FBR43_15980 [Sphingomonas baiyangensis]
MSGGEKPNIVTAGWAFESLTTGIESTDTLKAYVKEILAFTDQKNIFETEGRAAQILCEHMRILCVALDMALDDDADTEMRIVFKKRKRGPKRKLRADLVDVRRVFNQAAEALDSGDNFEAVLSEAMQSSGLGRTECVEWIASRRRARKLTLQLARNAIYDK